VGTLYLVATPIGNLEDMSPRAVRILRQVNLIAAEDTRQTQKLLNRFEIHTQLTSYFEHNKLAKLDIILAALDAGDVALVSDAGMPAINDPGYELVRAALAAGHTVSPVPGPSAPVAALAGSGLPTDTFLYLGYLPRRSAQRKRLLEQVAQADHTLIFLEAPHRLLESLDDLQAVLGDRPMAAARELTKLHEEFVRGSIGQVKAHFEKNAPRGEFVLVVGGLPASAADRWDEGQLGEAIRAGLRAGESPSQLASRLAGESGWKRREVYKRIASG
jgi:16S rRNA (cytidine1402-2'-O)-methyltransferase